LSILIDMKAREVVAALRKRGSSERPAKGSHVRFACPCGQHFTTVPMHSKDLGKGLVRAIESDMEPCSHFGKGWLR